MTKYGEIDCGKNSGNLSQRKCVENDFKKMT